jgi:hypothetical protein
MLRYLAVCLTASLLGCASTHDLKKDGPNIFGGGYIDEQIAPGLYLIKGFSNTSPFVTSDAAARTFENRARQLCAKGYVEVRALADSYKSNLAAPFVPIPSTGIGVRGPTSVVTSKIGHVLCVDSPLTPKEALALLGPDSAE